MSNPHPSANRPISTSGGLAAQVGLPSKLRKKSFQELFSRAELCYYGVAAVVYILLGLLLRDIVLNWIVGPLFIVLWMWQVPSLVEKWRAR